jgi:hypothetical protein
VFLTKLFAGLLSSYASYLFIQTFQKSFKTPLLQSWFLLLGIFSNCLLYQSVHYSSENIAAQLFLFGFCFCYRASKKLFLIGAIFGLAFIVRYQIGFMIMGLGLWMLLIQKRSFQKLARMFCGFLTILSIGVVLDSLYYDAWTLTPWNYFYENLVMHRAHDFGVSHWTYLKLALSIPYGPFYVFGIIYFMATHRSHPIAWLLFPFILIHLLIAHKEVRFMVPIFNFMPFTFLTSLETLEIKKHIKCLSFRWFQKSMKYAWWMNGLMILLPALTNIEVMSNYKFLYHYFGEHSYILNVWTDKKTLMPDNAVYSEMPYRFYLNSNAILKQYNNEHTYACDAFYPCILWLPCYAPRLEQRPIFDSCPIIDNALLNINQWKKRSIIYQNKGRLYQVN